MIAIRPLRTLEEFGAAETLQAVVWRITDGIEVVPLNILLPMSKNGGIVLGAFDGDRLVGCAFGFLARAPGGEFSHWSHINAVHPDCRGMAIGEKLKWAQREAVLAQGLTLIRWTFDPLEGLNGSLNVGKLGVTCREYILNAYGSMDDGLNAGIESDRFVANWRLNSPCVEARLQGGRPSLTLAQALETAPLALDSEPIEAGLRRPSTPVLDLEADRVLVEIPGQMQAVKRHDLALAQIWRHQTRQTFEAYFERGYQVQEFIGEFSEGQRRNFYLLACHPIY